MNSQIQNSHNDIFEKSLRCIANDLDLLRIEKSSRYRYDAITESLIWEDELPTGSRIRALHGMRAILRHRASLTLGELDTEFERYWQLGNELFPNWIGFTQSRVHPPADVCDFLRHAVQNTRNYVKSILDRQAGKARKE